MQASLRLVEARLPASGLGFRPLRVSELAGFGVYVWVIGLLLFEGFRGHGGRVRYPKP